MLTLDEVKTVVEIWTADEEWDISEPHESTPFQAMISTFEKKGFENLDTDLITEVLIDKLRDKYHNYADDETHQEAYELTQAVEAIVYADLYEED
jgi:hypothetical protein